MTLTEDELGEVLRLLRERRATQYDDALAALELSLVLGGQRIAQVLRLTADDVDMGASTVTLMDPKGRRESARRHVLPLTDVAMELVEAINTVRRAEWLFGDKAAPTHKDTAARKGVALLAEAQANIAKRAKSKAPVRPKIEARDLRRTAETMLAAMGISKDVRAQLLSHGLGGVQGPPLRSTRVHGREAQGATGLGRSSAGPGRPQAGSVQREEVEPRRRVVSGRWISNGKRRGRRIEA